MEEYPKAVRAVWIAKPKGAAVLLTAAERKALKEAIDRATRATLRPARRDARPGYFRSTPGIPVVVSSGHERTLPTLTDYDNRYIVRPQILNALNG